MGIVVWDLDSCIADTSPRHHLSPFIDSTQTWHTYAKACINDLPMDTIELVKITHALHRVHIVTGRRSSALAETIGWLSRYSVPHDELRMRTDHDPDSNTDYKIAYMKTLPEVPVLFISDWAPECQAVRKHLGIKAVCINPEYEKGQDPTMSSWMDNAPSVLESK